jgi:uncharacterized protein YqgQ
MTIRQLPQIIKKYGFIYRLIKRTENVHLYSQENKAGIVQTYEVFKNKLRDSKKYAASLAKLSGKNQKNDEYDFHEVFPTHEEFGKRAWSYPTFKTALIAFENKIL